MSFQIKKIYGKFKRHEKIGTNDITYKKFYKKKKLTSF
jgi:hypothetical protein